MERDGVTRKLSAILVADIVGYSRLMSQDEVGTLARLKDIRNELLEPKLDEYGGRLVKTTGDGVLLEFTSAVEAVRFAFTVQQQISARESSIEAANRIQYRIGINLGDVIHEDGDIYGDGVNIAARLEGLAEPGGVLISDTVFKSVKGKLDLGFEDLGSLKLKNIADPVQTYRVLLSPNDEGQIRNSRPKLAPAFRLSAMVIAAVLVLIMAAITTAPWLTRYLAPTPDIQSIAVMPFTNLSDENSQAYFANGMAEDLIVSLSRLSDVRVVSSNASFAVARELSDPRDLAEELNVDFLVGGSVRRIRDRLKLTTSLINGETGQNLWADNYEGKAEELFDLQEQALEELVRVLAVRLSPRERERLGVRGTQNVAAHDQYLLGLELENAQTRETNLEAEAAFMNAIQLDPNYAEAHAHLSLALSLRAEYRWTDHPDDTFSKAIEFGRKAIQINPDLPFARFSMGRLLSRRFFGDIDGALAELEAAIGLDGNYSIAHSLRATVLIFDGRAEEALEAITAALKNDPRTPHLQLGIAHYYLADYEAAEKALTAALEQNPASRPTLRSLIATYGRLGKTDDAQWMAAEYEALGQTASISDLMRNSSIRDASYRQAFEEGLRLAEIRK